MKYQVMPALTPIEYEALKADIAERGVLVPVEVDENGDMLDGHHRVMAWQELRSEGVNLPDYPRLIRSGLTEEQKRNHARSLNVLRRHLSKEQRESVIVDMANDGMSNRAIAEKVGVDEKTVRNALRGAEFSAPEYVTGKDGKQYPAQQQPKPEAPPTMFETTTPVWTPPTTTFVPGAAVAIDRTAAEETARQARIDRAMERDPNVRVKDLMPLMSSASDEWYTTPDIIDAAIACMGRIDLDPCSNSHESPNVPASRHYTKEDDGLSLPWFGNVYVNPPYGTAIPLWVDKIISEYQSGNIERCVLLLPARTDTQWFRKMAEYPKCFMFGRIKFNGHENSAPFPSMLVGIGFEQCVDVFDGAVSHLGDVYVRVTQR